MNQVINKGLITFQRRLDAHGLALERPWQHVSGLKGEKFYRYMFIPFGRLNKELHCPAYQKVRNLLIEKCNVLNRDNDFFHNLMTQSTYTREQKIELLANHFNNYLREVSGALRPMLTDSRVFVPQGRFIANGDHLNSDAKMHIILFGRSSIKQFAQFLPQDLVIGADVMASLNGFIDVIAKLKDTKYTEICAVILKLLIKEHLSLAQVRKFANNGTIITYEKDKNLDYGYALLFWLMYMPCAVGHAMLTIIDGDSPKVFLIVHLYFWCAFALISRILGNDAGLRYINFGTYLAREMWFVARHPKYDKKEEVGKTFSNIYLSYLINKKILETLQQRH